MFEIPIMSITGDPVFDYFFCIVWFFGLIAIVPSQIFKLLRY